MPGRKGADQPTNLPFSEEAAFRAKERRRRKRREDDENASNAKVEGAHKWHKIAAETDWVQRENRHVKPTRRRRRRVVDDVDATIEES